MIKVCSILLVLLTMPMSKGHFVWQQRVSDEKENVISTIFTFSELPGTQNAGKNEQLPQILYDKGIEVNYVNMDTGETVKVQPELKGLYIEAKVAKVLPKSFVLEGFCQWGIFAERGPPSLLKYYTSASHAPSGYKYENMQKASTNKFRADLEIAHGSGKCRGQGSRTGNSQCVRVTIVYENSPLPQTEVSVFHGDSDPTTVVTDTDGVAYFTVPRADKRVSVRANHNIDSPGETSDGETYESVSNWVTSVLELTTDLEVFPPPQEQTDTDKPTDQAESKSADESKSHDTLNFSLSMNQLVFIVIPVALVSGFIASLVSNMARYRAHNVVHFKDSSEPTIELEKLDVDVC